MLSHQEGIIFRKFCTSDFEAGISALLPPSFLGLGFWSWNLIHLIVLVGNIRMKVRSQVQSTPETFVRLAHINNGNKQQPHGPLCDYWTCHEFILISPHENNPYWLLIYCCVCCSQHLWGHFWWRSFHWISVAASKSCAELAWGCYGKVWERQHDS